MDWQKHIHTEYENGFDWIKAGEYWLSVRPRDGFSLVKKGRIADYHTVEIAVFQEGEWVSFYGDDIKPSGEVASLMRRAGFTEWDQISIVFLQEAKRLYDGLCDLC